MLSKPQPGNRFGASVFCDTNYAMGAKDILSELEEIGVFGEEQPSEKPLLKVVHESKIEKAPPSSSVQDARGPHMLAFFDRAIELLETSIKAQVELHELFEEVRSMWLEDESGPPEEVEEEEQDASEVDDSGAVLEVSSEEALDSKWLEVDEEEDGPVSEPVPIRSETSNAILDFYQENEAAGVTLGVEEEPPAQFRAEDPKEAFAQGRARFMESLKAESERGTVR